MQWLSSVARRWAHNFGRTLAARSRGQHALAGVPESRAFLFPRCAVSSMSPEAIAATLLREACGWGDFEAAWRGLPEACRQGVIRDVTDGLRFRLEGRHLLTQQEWEAMTAEVHALKADNAALARELRATANDDRTPAGCWCPAYWADPEHPHKDYCQRLRALVSADHPGAALLSEVADLRRELAEAKRAASDSADALTLAQQELQAARKDADGYSDGWTECQKERDAAQQRVRELEGYAGKGLAAWHGTKCEMARGPYPMDPAECEDHECREWAQAVAK